MEHENQWKSVRNSFQMRMARLAATRHQRNVKKIAFSTLINYFRKLFKIFKGYFQTSIS